jgi:hypothetical protein
MSNALLAHRITATGTITLRRWPGSCFIAGGILYLCWPTRQLYCFPLPMDLGGFHDSRPICGMQEPELMLRLRG